MKIDRLLGILIMLSKKEKVTAPYLAEYFEVSKRTIMRDIDTLCKAGVPIYTKQGNNGGIAIVDGYKLDKTILTDDELTNVIVGLNALKSVGDNRINHLIDKFLIDEADDTNIKIELGSFYRDSLTDKIKIINNAIKDSRKIRFTYYSKKGESEKVICPYSIIYKWKDWYMQGFIDSANETRTYKLNRMWDLAETDLSFQKADNISMDMTDLDEIFPDNYYLEAVFDVSQKYLLVESYGNKSFSICNDGKLLFKRSFTNFDYMLSWILSFGDKVKVLKPKELVEAIKNISQNNINNYSET